MPHTCENSFNPKPSSFSLFLSFKLFYDVCSTLKIFQRESEKTIWKADFELKFLQRIGFWIKIFTTRQILKEKNTSKKHDFEENNNFKKHDFEEKNTFKKRDFEEKIILDFEKKFAHKKIRFWLILPPKMGKFCVLGAFLKRTILMKIKKGFEEWFEEKNFFKERDFEEKIIVKKHHFEWKDFVKSMIFRFVRFWNKIFTKCQILNQLLKNASNFEEEQVT